MQSDRFTASLSTCSRRVADASLEEGNQIGGAGAGGQAVKTLLAACNYLSEFLTSPELTRAAAHGKRLAGVVGNGQIAEIPRLSLAEADSAGEMHIQDFVRGVLIFIVQGRES